MASPTYIRIDKSSKEFHTKSDKVILGKPSVIKEGVNGVVISTGSYLATVTSAINKLKEKGYDLKVISLHTLKPVDSKSLISYIKGYKKIFTIEEHRLMGGLGSIVGEILLDNNVKNIELHRIGISDKYSPVIGKQDYLRKYYEVDEDAIVKKILKHYIKK